MGLDFIRKTAKTSLKSWNRGAHELAQPSLFSRRPECRTRAVIFALEPGCAVELGSRHSVVVDGDGLALLSETRRVGGCAKPPDDLLKAFRDAGGCALGEIAKVHPISGSVDVQIQ